MAKHLFFLVLIVGTLLVRAVGADAAKPTDAPLGLWIWSAAPDDGARNVAVERTGDTWRATVNGEPASVAFSAGKLRLDAPGGERFVGALSQDGSTIAGHWRQPSTPLGYSTMVTHAVFSAVGDNRWADSIAAQPRPFRVYLDIFENDDGALAAVVRNPERNEIMRTPQFRVEKDGPAAWALVAGDGEHEIRRTLTEVAGGLLLDHAWFDAPLKMRRAQDADLAGYYPRPPGPARYAPPERRDDGWMVTAPEEAGFDRAPLDALVADLARTDPRAPRPRLIHAVLAAHKGRLFLEEYFYGYGRETPHDTRSLGKVFAPVLVGALRQQGAAIDGDVRPIPDLLAAAGLPTDDPRKNDITLAQLMSFTSGLDCDVTDPDSLGSEDSMWGQQDEDDFWLYTARLPVRHEPGARYAYCSGSINLVGASLRAVGGEPIVDLFGALIAEPLQFGPYSWNLAPNGAAYLGGGVYMRPRDILKIGAVFAANGQWKDEQVIDAAWVAESTTPVIDITPETTGMTPEAFADNYFGGAAAYEWRIDTVTAGARTYRSYEASGNGGQLLIVVPALDLTVLFMGGNYRQGGIWGRWRNEIVGGHIIPAITER
ncbi:MAG: serine hydrolase domain-containing protein [Pseudomonadota bacterium]